MQVRSRWLPLQPEGPLPSATGALIATMAFCAIVGVAGMGGPLAAAEPRDAALQSERPWTRFLAEAFPEGLDPDRSLEPPSIRDPGPDTANYPNGPSTLPRGGIYLEYSPVFFTAPITTIQPQT